MTAPNLPPTRLHAFAQVSAAGELLSTVNVVEIEKDGTGIYIVTLGSGIGGNQRHISLTLREGGQINILPPEGEDLPGQFTVETFGIGEGTFPDDLEFELCVFRTITPS